MNGQKFSFEKVDELTEVLDMVIVDGKIQKKISPECRIYLEQYFFTSVTGHYYFWDAETKLFCSHTKKSLKAVYLNKLPQQVSNWFFKENRKLYTVVSKADKPKIFGTKLNLYEAPGDLNALMP